MIVWISSAWRRAMLVAMLLVTTALAGCDAATGTSTPLAAVPGGVSSASTTLGNGISNVRLLVLPDDGKRLLTRPIRAALHTIDLTMYLLTDHTMIHDLEYAHANGVRVRVLLEPHPFGSASGVSSTNQSAYDQLYAAGIAVRWTPAWFRLTHEKTMVIDGATAYILTLNFTRSAFKSNREFGVVDTTPADAREAEAIFTADWNGGAYTPRDPNLLVSPVNSRSGLLALLRRARHSVEVYAEEVQDPGIEAALVAARRRGAVVRLISNAGDTSNVKGLAVLSSGGVRTRLIRAPYVHAKAIVVDGAWAFIGSENISASSLDRNRELGILIADRQAIDRLLAVFARDWAG